MSRNAQGGQRRPRSVHRCIAQVRRAHVGHTGTTRLPKCAFVHYLCGLRRGGCPIGLPASPTATVPVLVPCDRPATVRRHNWMRKLRRAHLEWEKRHENHITGLRRCDVGRDMRAEFGHGPGAERARARHHREGRRQHRRRSSRATEPSSSSRSRTMSASAASSRPLSPTSRPIANVAITSRPRPDGTLEAVELRIVPPGSPSTRSMAIGT